MSRLGYVLITVSFNFGNYLREIVLYPFTMQKTEAQTLSNPLTYVPGKQAARARTLTPKRGLFPGYPTTKHIHTVNSITERA